MLRRTPLFSALNRQSTRQSMLGSIVIGASVVAAFVGLTCCGKSTSEDSGGGAATASFSGNQKNVTGTITSQSGTPAQMKSWVVALIERDFGLGRVSEVDASGILKWGNLNLDATHTAVLLSPDFLIQSVIALPSTKANTVKQYFTLAGIVIPQLVQKGSSLSFQTTTGITIQDYCATDTDADGNPDGVGSLGLALSGDPLGLATVDTDKDGVSNDSDVDLDGDGILNVFDGDDDADGILDVFDADANGNGVADNVETVNDAYFALGLEYFAVKHEKTATGATLQFAAKVRSGVQPIDLKIRSAASLTGSATTLATDGTSAAWDGTLIDDGTGYDGSSGDLLYGRKITLAAGKAPRVNQVVFLQMTIGTGETAFTVEYPWTFTSLTLSAITSTYVAATRVATLAGNPFGADNQSFFWSISVTNAAGVKVYESSAVSGGTRTLTIPSNVLESGVTYSYEAVAQSLEKVPGIPSISVRSAAVSIVNP
jgi:hypothetical protein